MKIGMMGLGKLGLPCALAIERAGHEVVGWDPSETVLLTLMNKKLPYREEGAQELLDNTKIHYNTVSEMVASCDLIFVAVQTPHHPRYEGITRLPTKRVDFDYTYIKQATTQLAIVAAAQKKDARVVIISTVLPGTIEREIRPILDEHHNYVKLCYNPFFIAMGTTIYDFTHPEFVLFGVDDIATAMIAETFYKTIHNKPFYKTTIKNAEMIKVSYNTYISTKLAFVNTLMEVCHKTGCDVDAVTDALKMADERLISPRYMTAGMGDGGGCHPRDNIALSWLARKIEMGYDFFEAIMLSREKQTDWFADLVENEVIAMEAVQGAKPSVTILGKAFKPETNLVTGSPSRLLENILKERNINAVMLDPQVDEDDLAKIKVMEALAENVFPGVFFIGTRHEFFKTVKFPKGSVVLDPHRYIPDQQGVNVIRLGEGAK